MSQIITTSDLQTYLGSGVTLDAARAATIVNSVNQYVETETKRVWGTTKTVTETYDFGKTLWLRHQDVQTISEITVGWPGQTQSTLDPSGYFCNELGRVTMFWTAFSRTAATQSPAFNDYVHVTYEYGNDDVPADLKEAALGVAVGLYNWASAGGNEMASYSVGNYRVETIKAIRSGGASGPTPFNNAAEHHFMVIQSYKMKRL